MDNITLAIAKSYVDDKISGVGGVKGDKGEDGFSPIANVKQTESGAIVTITDKDGSTSTIITNGEKGEKGSDGYTPQKNIDYFDGQDGKDGIGITSVEQTIASTEDGGINIVTVKKSDNTTSTFQIRNGSKGDKGDKGENGKDGSDASVTTENIKMALGYTPANQEKVNQLSNEIADLNISKVEQSDLETEVKDQLDGAKADIVAELITQIGGLPVFGTVNDDNTITVTSILADGTYTIMYENKDGTTTKIGDIVIGDGEGEPIMINLAIPNSADWKVNKRINSSKNEVDIPESSLNGETMVMTNFIDISDFTNNTKLYIKGLNLLATTGVGYNYNRIYFYDETKSYKIYWQPSGQYVSNYLNVSDYNEDIQIFTNIQQLMSCLSELNGVPAKYMVIGAVLTGDSEEVIISKDVQITT